MEFPLVSIIVPMYNTAGCICPLCQKASAPRLIKSIEILLLNDGSTDDTLAVCRALAASDHRIALVDKNQHRRSGYPQSGHCAGPRQIHPVCGQRRLAGPLIFTENAGLRRRGPHRRSCDRALLDGVPGKSMWSTSAHGKRRCSMCSSAIRPSTRGPMAICLPGMYTGQEYAKHLIQKPNTFYYGSPLQQALPP